MPACPECCNGPICPCPCPSHDEDVDDGDDCDYCGKVFRDGEWRVEE
jgi:hypothetical protein